MVVLSALMFYFIGEKQGFHEDEMFSYGSSNYKYDNVFRPFGYAEAIQDVFYKQVLIGSPLNQIHNIKIFLTDPDKFSKDEVLKKEIPIWKTKAEALEYLAIQKEDVFNYFSVYYNQAKDVHPPMFYFLVHFVSTLFFNTFSKYIIFIINLSFFIGTLFVIKKIFDKLECQELTIPTLILYGASMGAISTVMFQRMYMMLTFFSVLYLYLTIKFIKDDFKVKNKFIWILTIVLGFLTQYYFCIYIVLVFLLVSIYLVRKKEYKKLLSYFMLHLIGAVIGIIFYPFSIEDIFFSYRGLGATDGHSRSFIQMFLYYIQQIVKLFSFHYISLLLFFSIIFIGIYKFINKKLPRTNQKENFYFWILFLPILLFIIIVSKIAPFLGHNYTSRYIMLLFPMIAIFIVYGLTFIFEDRKRLFIGILVFSIFLSIHGFLINTPTYLYKDNKKVMTLAHLYQDDYFVYIYDNYFTHLSSMEEFSIYKNSLILNKNIHEFSLLDNPELKESDEFILCIKKWLDVENILQDVLKSSGYLSYEKLLDLNTDVEAVYYKIIKK